MRGGRLREVVATGSSTIVTDHSLFDNDGRAILYLHFKDYFTYVFHMYVMLIMLARSCDK